MTKATSPAVTTRRDLAATMAPLWRSLLSAEREVAATFDLSMWAYAALHALAEEPVRSQAVLATGLGLDKTRLISVLDDLQARGLIRREPDPDDRRVRILSLTPKGHRLFLRVQRVVHEREDRLLEPLAATERAALVGALETLRASITARAVE